MNIDTLKEQLAAIDADSLRKFIFDLYHHYPELGDRNAALTVANDPVALARSLHRIVNAAIPAQAPGGDHLPRS